MMVLVAGSCQKETTQLRTRSSLNFATAYTSGLSSSNAVTYRGVVASRVASDGEWESAPWDSECTSWTCRFVGGKGTVYTQNDLLYGADTYDFYLLGSNGNSVVPDASGVLEVDGGEIGTNDYIWAKESVTFSGASDVTKAVSFSHLFSQVRFELEVRGNSGVSDVASVIEIKDISNLGYRIDGVINLESVTSPVMQPSTRNKVLSTASFGERYMVVPHNGSTYAQPTNAKITVVVDGRTFTPTLSGELSLNAGKCRVITLVYDGVNIYQLEIPQWNIGEDFSIGEGDTGGYEIPGWGTGTGTN